MYLFILKYSQNHDVSKNSLLYKKFFRPFLVILFIGGLGLVLGIMTLGNRYMWICIGIYVEELSILTSSTI